MAVVGGGVVDVVVAGAVVPGDAGGAQKAQVARVERQVVGDHIAVVDTERRPADGQHRGDDVVPHIVELGDALGLGIGHEQGLELGRLLPTLQGEVDGPRQRPGRLDQRVARVDLARAPSG